MKVVLDTNCLLDAVTPSASTHGALQRILQALDSGRIQVLVSLHNLAELTKSELPTQLAIKLASKLPQLPHWPIGSWDDQVCTWNQATGSWDDGRKNDVLQHELSTLAKSGNDIRDRGAYLDALLAQADIFVTSDKQFVDNGPAERIRKRFGLRIMEPTALVQELNL